MTSINSSFRLQHCLLLCMYQLYIFCNLPFWCCLPQIPLDLWRSSPGTLWKRERNYVLTAHLQEQKRCLSPGIRMANRSMALTDTTQNLLVTHASLKVYTRVTEIPLESTPVKLAIPMEVISAMLRSTLGQVCNTACLLRIYSHFESAQDLSEHFLEGNCFTCKGNDPQFSYSPFNIVLVLLWSFLDINTLCRLNII